VLRSLADLQVCDRKIQTEGTLVLNAFADNASAIRGTVSNNFSDDRSLMPEPSELFCFSE